MKEILLTQGFAAIVDNEDYEELSRLKWHCSTRGNRPGHLYAVRRQSAKSGKRGKMRMHRVIMNAPDGMEVDHIDGDELNNQRANLRVCTRKQNGRSRGKHVAKTSRYKGVYLDKVSGKWRAIIQPDGGAKGLGAHGTEREAARAYNKAAIEEFGTFARLNEVEDDGR